VSDQVALPETLEPRRLGRRAIQVIAFIAVIVLVALLAPGLGDVRNQLEGASLAWLGVAVVLELLSCASYVLMFRPIFCSHMSVRTSTDLALSELAVGSLVPASGAGGLALGAWVLHQGGMPGEKIARRSVAFFIIKSSVNFVAVAVIGAVMAVGLVGPRVSLWLTALPAALATLVLVAVVALPRFGPGERPPEDASRTRRWIAATRRALIDGVMEAIAVVRSRNLLVLAGAIGYWLFDNACLWAAYKAIGDVPPLSIVLLGYLIGQLGGLLPLPGGAGGIDGGLIGTLVVFGAPVAATVAAVLAYRVILFWVPLIVGGVAFFRLRKALNDPDRPDLCAPMPIAEPSTVVRIRA
jgi:uncharacterized protein (TIRG00374 family)